MANFPVDKTHRLVIQKALKQRVSIQPASPHRSRVNILLADQYLSAQAPSAPTNLSVDDFSATTVDLSWTAPPEQLDSYTLYVYNVTSGTLEQTITGLTMTSAQVMGLTTGAEYEFWVTATYFDQESAESNHQTVQLQTDAPTGLTVTEIVSSLSGGSLEFSGGSSNQAVVMGDVHDMGLGDLTLEILFKLHENPFDANLSNLAGIIGKQNEKGYPDREFAYGLNMRIDEITPRFNDSDDLLGNQDFPYTSQDTDWHHAAVTFDRDGNMTAYVDSQSLGTTDISPYSTDDFQQTMDFFIGAYSREGTASQNRSFDGFLKEARIWNKVLTPAELEAVAFETLDGDEPGLIGYWPLNEGSGTTAADSTSNGNHGTLENSPTWSSESPQISGHEFNWNAVSGADGYNLYINKDGGGYVKENTTLISGTTYIVEDLQVGSYSAYVTAEKNSLESGPSNVVSFIVQSADEGLLEIYYEKPGTDEIYKSGMDTFSPSLVANAKYTFVEDLAIDSYNDKIVHATRNGSPDVQFMNLDGSDDTYGGGGGTWNIGCYYNPPDNTFVVCDTFETLWFRDYASVTTQRDVSLFSTRQGRPVKVKIDWADQIAIVQLSGESNRVCSFDLNNAENNETDLVSPSTAVFHIDMNNNKVYYRDPSDATAIRRINYDGTSDEAFYQHNETIRCIVLTEANTGYIYFSTATGVYALNILSKSVSQIISSTEIGIFDFYYSTV